MDPFVAESSSSSRAPPFSLVEFGNLVSAALDSPFPILSSDSSPLFSVSYNRETPQETEQSGSRVRQIIKKLKKRASTLVKRPSPRSVTSVRASSPEYRIPELRLSSNVSCADFVPYIPLVAQYERASPHVRQLSTCRSTPSLPTQRSLKTLYDTSNAFHSFPKSPSTSSCSSGSTSSESQYPTTPLNNVFEESTLIRRWSCSTETDESPFDPFAKPPVSMSLPHTPTFIASSVRPYRRAHLPPSPPNPPPKWPLPALPPPESTHPYRRAMPLWYSSSESLSESLSDSAPASPTLRSRKRTSLLDAFPAPPTFTPLPMPETPPRRCRASSPFPFTPTRNVDWLDLMSSPGSELELEPEPESPASESVPDWDSSPDDDDDDQHSCCGSVETSTSGHSTSDDAFHSACSG
ncbi:hypothetical protein C8R45DRAFT_553458 [Mycena sanguinolenta]|nr:hypothetical protein C8R45DRAFT_553458 [Mycena sanguinolenta]